MGSGERGGSGAVAVGGDQLGDVALVEALAQAPQTFRARSRITHGDGERHRMAKQQVSGLRGVRVSVEYLHRGRYMANPCMTVDLWFAGSWGFMRGRVAKAIMGLICVDLPRRNSSRLWV